MKNRPLPIRLACAFAGIGIVWRRERTFRTHGLFALTAVAVAAALRVGAAWWALIALCIALVLALEALNASVEYAIDRLHPELHEEIRHAKDAAAGAVLLASIGAAIVGMLMVVACWPG